MSGAVPGAAEARANRIGNARDAPNRDDVHWLVSEAIGAWHRLAVLEAERDALTGALDSLGRVWEGLCRCVDEFEPEYPAACDERRNDLYSAVERALEQARGGRDGGE